MSMDNIAGRIAARMLFTGRRDRAEVVREIAKEDRRAGLHHRLRAASHPTTRQHDDPRQTLYEAIAARSQGVLKRPFPAVRRTRARSSACSSRTPITTR